MLTWTTYQHVMKFKKCPFFRNLSSTVTVCRQNAQHSCLGSERQTRKIRKKRNMQKTKLFHPSHDYSISQCLAVVTHSLTQSRVSEPKSTAEYILAFAMGQRTIHGIKIRDVPTPCQLNKMEKLTSLAGQRLPIQYVLGEWDFRDLTLEMRPPVFIPRPETEELVGHIVRDPQAVHGEWFIEVGCGTGAISLAIMKSLPQIQCVAIDRSEAACELTLHNACKLGLDHRIQVLHRELDSEMGILSELAMNSRVDFVVSNPPYIPTKDMKTLQFEVSRFEDQGALHGGKDGLDIIRRILKMASHVLKPEGSLWLEVDTQHPEVLKHLCKETNGLAELFPYIHYKNTYLDFMNRPRFCHLKYIPS